jgi:hypothetical protein
VLSTTRPDAGTDWKIFPVQQGFVIGEKEDKQITVK